MRLLSIRVLIACFSLSILVAPTIAQNNKPKTLKKPVAPPRKPSAVKGQGQLVGGIGRFGETYTLKTNFNFTILGAHYTLEPIGDYSNQFPAADQKLLVIDVAFKNVSTSDNWYGNDGLFTLVDSKGGLYTVNGGICLHSTGRNSKNNLRPGQGEGQIGLNDPLRVAFPIPADVTIAKIMVNSPRQNITEEVFRYYIAGTTKVIAGENGDPANVITPLPENVRDPSDPAGATALPEGKGVVGATALDCASNQEHFRVDSVKLSDENLNGNPPDEGKLWAVVTITASYPLLSGKAADFKELTIWDFPGGGGGFAQMVDAEGDKYDPAQGLRKLNKDEALADNRTLSVGDQYTYRLFFSVPKETPLKKVVLGATNGRRWAFEIK